MSREASNQRNSRCGGCEWSTEEDGEDVDDDRDAEEGPAVLWKQTICIDIGDGENVHLSHLQSSITVHVSQGSAASSENTGLFGSYNNEDSSLSCSSISSKHRNHNTSDGKENKMKIMLPQTNKAPDRMRCRHEDDNTSDEDQDELPYDRELHYNATHHNSDQNQTSKSTCTLNMKCSQVSDEFHSFIFGRHHVAEQERDQVIASVPDYLLRHFSQDELLNGTRLIEAETMPEVSLLESIDESVMITASPNPGAKSMNNKTNISLEFSRSESQTASKVMDLKSRSREREEQNNNNSQVGLLDSSKESSLLCIGNVESGPLAEAKNDDTEQTLNPSCSSSTPDLYKADIQSVKFPLGRTRSCGELKYGQGKVHYPRPDFSKVAPKVKIPKTNTVSKPGYTSAVDKTPAQQGVLGKSSPSCKADVISRVLEDSFWVIEKSKLLQDEEAQIKLDQELQAECNRLLSKYASDDDLQNVRTPLAQVFPSFGAPHLSIHCGETVDVLDIQHRKDQIRPVTKTFPSANSGLDKEMRDTKQQDLTEGQRLTTELKDIINQFVMKVDEFKKCINNTSMTIEEQQLMFKSMMEAQDQLERNYMRKKEEHRTLEMQRYMGLDKNAGEFDPDRQVEGEIFRLGMHLEDIKERIDRNACCELTALSSTSHTSLLHEDVIQSPSVYPTLRKESLFRVSSRDKEEKHVNARAEDSSLSVPSETSVRSQEDEEGSVSMPEEEYDNEDILEQLTNQVSSKPHQTPGRSNANSTSSTSMTDSVTSISNMRTAVYIATCAEPDQFSCDDQNMEWKYTTHNTPVHMHMMENVPGGAMLPVAGLHEAGHKERSRSLLIQRHPASLQTENKHPNCTCSNEAIRALQYEVSQLKRLLEESLGPLAHLASLNRRDRRVQARPSSSHQNRSSSSSRCLNMDLQKVDDWISSDVESSRSKASLENLSVDRRSSDASLISNAVVRPASCRSKASTRSTNHRSRAFTRFIDHGNSTNLGLTFHRNPARTNTDYIRSCFSLPSGFKVKDRQSEPEGARRRSTQSDSALLQSDVYFDWAATLPISPHRSRQRVQRHRASKEEAINSTLDKALEAVSLMKQTTDRMAKTLSEDLTKARLYRKLHSQHLSERKKT